MFRRFDFDHPFLAAGFFLICVVMGYVLVGMLRKHVRPGARKTIYWAAALWLVSVSIRAKMGWYLEPHDFPPRFLIVIAPWILGLAALAWSRKAGDFAEKFSQNFLIGIQGFRVLVELCILALHRRDLMPEEMTFHGQNFDIIPGITALILAAFVRTDSVRWVGPIVLWNIVSMGVLLVTITTGALSAPGPLRLLKTEIPNIAPLTFPYVLLPAFLVPLAFAFHILSLKRARRTLQAAAREGSEDRPLVAPLTLA
ncbi:MAG TPA: hypothetical protein VEH27_01320 [Methylomirabilota bacterium]|nr:hypothetical protein [Methylomirabilota bacterium]